jgi:hypothetical protein
MEVGMRQFSATAMTAKANNGEPEVVDENMLQTVSIAEKIAPMRSPSLTHLLLGAARC